MWQIAARDEPAAKMRRATVAARARARFRAQVRSGYAMTVHQTDLRPAGERPGDGPALAAGGRAAGLRVLGLAWRQTLRDLRSGELRLLVVAVMLAALAVSVIGRPRVGFVDE